MKLNEPGIAEIRYVESFLAAGEACTSSIFRPTHRYICLEFAAKCFRAQELYESRGGRPELPVPNKPYGSCGRKATSEEEALRFVPMRYHIVGKSIKIGAL